MVPSFLEVVLSLMKGLLLWGMLHLILFSVAGIHWLFSGVLPCIHGRKGGILEALLWFGGKSQLILSRMGPAPLSILGFAEGGLWFSSSRRSGISPLDDNLDRGCVSSSDLVGVLPGNFIGEMFLFVLLGSFFAVSLSLFSEVPGFGDLGGFSLLESC